MRLPNTSDIQIVGGPQNTPDIFIRPPWQGERVEAVLLYVTAWGNTGTNILYVTADSGEQVLNGGTGTIPQPVNGAIIAVNGVDTKVLSHSPIGVTQFLRVTPAPASSGQIYIGFYWRQVVVPGRPIALPDVSPEEQAQGMIADKEAMKEEDEVWRTVRGLPPREYLQQNPGQLSKEQEKQLKEFEALTDMRNHLAGIVTPGGRSAR